MLKYKTLTAATLAAVLFPLPFTLIAPLTLAQVEVVELEVPSTRSSADTTAAVSDVQSGYGARMAKPTPASMTDFYFQLQTLQQEVQTLRGLVEEQNFQLKKLKQQRLDDYLDLDRRVSGLSRASTSTTSTPRAPTQNMNVAPIPVTALAVEANPQDELVLYRSGIDAVLKKRDYETGLKQFDAYLAAYPSGIYAANAKYWLGQVYLQQDDLSNSSRWFSDLIANHPNHQKTPEAQFKLGKVLHLQGDLPNAKKQLKMVVVSGSSAAKLAQDYLTKHF